VSEERLERVENLLVDLIKMVANNNAMLVEVKSDVTQLKTDVAQLKTEMEQVQRDQAIFKEELFTQSARMDDNHKDLMKQLSEVALNANYAVSMVGKHDKELFALKERLSV